MFGLSIRSKWSWFAVAAIFLFSAWYLSVPVGKDDGESTSVNSPLVVGPARLTTRSVVGGATRTPTVVPTPWRTPTPYVQAVSVGLAAPLCPSGKAVPSGAPMWLTATGTSFSQSGYVFEAEGEKAGALTGVEQAGLCQTTVQGRFGAAWYDPGWEGSK